MISDKNRNQDLPSSTIVIVAVAVNSALIVGEIVRTNQYENNKFDWKLKEDIQTHPTSRHRHTLPDDANCIDAAIAGDARCSTNNTGTSSRDVGWDWWRWGRDSTLPIDALVRRLAVIRTAFACSTLGYDAALEAIPYGQALSACSALALIIGNRATGGIRRVTQCSSSNDTIVITRVGQPVMILVK